LGFWLFGDSLNLLGSVLTHQLAFQRVSGMVFVFMDFCIIFQFFYYGKKQADVGRPRTPLLNVSFLNSSSWTLIILSRFFETCSNYS
jgi:hypothetical protein